MAQRILAIREDYAMGGDCTLERDCATGKDCTMGGDYAVGGVSVMRGRNASGFHANCFLKAWLKE